MQVSRLLDAGDIASVEACLGRPHRLVINMPPPAALTAGAGQNGTLLLPPSTYLSRPPGPGRSYPAVLQLVPCQGEPCELQDEEAGGPCAVGAVGGSCCSHMVDLVEGGVLVPRRLLDSLGSHGGGQQQQQQYLVLDFVACG